MNLTEAVKEELDKECFDEDLNDIKGMVFARYCPMEDEKTKVYDCWQCHKHDALAARIADRVKEVRT